MKRNIKYLLVGLVAFFATSAQAGILKINFQDIADGNTATSNGAFVPDPDFGAAKEAGWQPFKWDFGNGLILTVRGFETDGVSAPDPTSDAESYAYLDKSNAGMGVCSSINSSKQCVPSSDDNVSFGEYLALSFSKAVTIDSLVLNNNHDGGFKSSNVNINGTDTPMVDGTGGKSILGAWSLAANEVFTLAYSNLSGIEPPESDIRTNHFYLESAAVSAVPEPSAIALFAFGLTGLGLAGRRKRKQG